jgi:hypothetical protein
MKSSSSDKFSKNDFNKFKKHSTSPAKRSEAFQVWKIANKFARRKMIEKYQTNENTMNTKIISDIIYNEKAHIVSGFKDHLIFDDSSEFLKRFYKWMESKLKLPKIF